MEWIHQFQRVSEFNQWGPNQQLRHIEFSLEGVAAKWLQGLRPRPNTYDDLIGSLQAAFRHHNYAMELESRLRSRKQGPDEPVMSYCYDIIYLCSKVDPEMNEERKTQFIFQNMDPELMQKVFPQMDRLDTTELFRRLQAHCQASLMAGRSIPLNSVNPTPPPAKRGDIEQIVRDEVARSLGPVIRQLEQATRSFGSAGGSQNRAIEGGQNASSSNQLRKRTIDGRPICNSCRKPGHIARNCPEEETTEN
jgi:hypothetical protein